MPKKPITNSVPLERGQIPDSLKRILEKVPTPEAIKVLEDIGSAAWIVDNNNNNKASVLEERLIDNLVKMPTDKLRQLL